MGLLMFLGSFLSHEKFVSLLPILFHHPFGTTRPRSFLGSFFGSVGTAVSPSINLSPRDLFSFAFVVLPSHLLLYVSGLITRLVPPGKKMKK
jgi:hypothetical protein